MARFGIGKPMNGFYIGTYSKPLGNMQANGEGIYHSVLEPETGAFGRALLVAEAVNPSYLAWGPGRGNLYATREVFAADGPALLAYKLGKDDRLEKLGEAPVKGELPCHLDVDERGRFLASAQYKTGNALVFKLLPDGGIGQELQDIRHRGSGPNPQRQEAPHVHFVKFTTNPDELVAVDLGIDQLLRYPVEPMSDNLDAENPTVAKVSPGAGPRHFVMSPDGKHVYLFSEMSAEIFHFERDGMRWCQRQTISACPGASAVSGAAIRLSPCGAYLYVSERSRSEIICFAIDPPSGALVLQQRIPSGGLGPRDFALTKDGRFMVVANQLSNSLTSLRIDQKSGQMQATGHELAIGSPVCVLL